MRTKIMEGQEKPTEKLINTAGQMIETYRDLVSLTVVENVSLGVSVSVVGIITLVFICFVLLFGALGAAWWIGEAMNNMKAGFFIAGSAFLLLLLIVLISAKNGLIPMIRNLVIKKIYEHEARN
ncbi:MAG: hypothetical protein WDO14_03080 [Bacteroidota bacterium]